MRKLTCGRRDHVKKAPIAGPDLFILQKSLITCESLKKKFFFVSKTFRALESPEQPSGFFLEFFGVNSVSF